MEIHKVGTVLGYRSLDCYLSITRADELDLADDKNIDLVVCTVRVDRHYKTITPAIKAGKNVLVEWPLGKNLQEAEELLRLTKEYGVKVAAVGCQGRFDSTFRTVKKLIHDDKIGKVLSTTVVGCGILGGPTLDAANEYVGHIEIGGNLVTIPFGHFMDAFTTGVLTQLFAFG
jgi:predicted dehydrogenase